jgi:hypothetical protein
MAIFFTTKDTKFTKGGKCLDVKVFLCVLRALRGFIIFSLGHLFSELDADFNLPHFRIRCAPQIFLMLPAASGE